MFITQRHKVVLEKCGEHYFAPIKSALQYTNNTHHSPKLGKIFDVLSPNIQYRKDFLTNGKKTEKKSSKRNDAIYIIIIIYKLSLYFLYFKLLLILFWLSFKAGKVFIGILRTGILTNGTFLVVVINGRPSMKSLIQLRSFVQHRKIHNYKWNDFE